MRKIFICIISFVFLFQLDGKAQNRMNPQENKMNQQGNKMGCILNNPSATIDLTEINFLKSSREEVKMARDLYDLLNDKYQIESFINYSQVKQKNMGQISCVINHYKINEIETGKQGIYNDLNIQQLYNDMKDKGSLSKDKALNVAAQVEEMGINNLNSYLKFTKNPAIISRLKNINCNSKNNLRALVSEINSTGEVYSPLFLDAKDYTKIIKKKNEQCTMNNPVNNLQGQGKSAGKGGGQNKGQGRHLNY